MISAASSPVRTLRSTRSFLSLLATVIAVIYIAAAAGVTANLLTPVTTDSNASEVSGIYTLSWVIIYISSLIIIIPSIHSRINLRESFIIFFSMLIISGFIWSEIPTNSLRLSISLVANILFAWACYRQFSLESFLRIVMWTLLVMIAIGIVLAIVGFPNAFYHDPMQRGNILGTPLIRGLFSHKIYASFYAGIALILSLKLLNGWKRLFAVFLAALGILLPGSSTGLLGFIIGLFVTWGIPALRNSHSRIMFAMFGIALVFGISSTWDIIAANGVEALGRDITLTGRTILWQFAIDFWMQHPILGWSYGGIFSQNPDAPGHVITVESYVAPHFHSAYFQALAELGIVGLLPFLFIILSTLAIAIGNVWRIRRPEDTVAAAIIIMICCIGTVMNIGMRYNELSTILLFYLFLATARSRSQVASGSSSFRRRNRKSLYPIEQKIPGSSREA